MSNPDPGLPVLDELRSRIRLIFGEQLLGLYPYGSLILGDFNPAISDIDLVAVAKHEVTKREF